jgi:hypothetical protein
MAAEEPVVRGCLEQAKAISRSKAALKTPQSKRYRDCRAPANFAKRLDCGVFSAAFLTTRTTTNCLVGFFSPI